MVGKRGWFESLQTTSRVPSIISIDQKEICKEGIEAGGLPAYNSALVYIISSVQHTLPSGFKCLQVHTLLKETITLAVHTKCKVWDVYLCCCSHLKMKESRLLGLASRVPSEGFGSDRPRHEYYFLDSSCKITKYGLKHWRFNYPWTSHSEGRPFLVLHLRVRIYISDTQFIKCPIVLNYYYLQLRENLLDQWSSPESVSEERCWKMASIAYEADSARIDGQDNADVGKTSSSFRPERYFPLWVINTRGLEYVRRNLRSIESGQKTRTKEDAIREFCEHASSSPFALNCHLYGLRQYKMDTVDNAFIGITPNGVEMSDVGDDGGRNLRRILQWGDIVLLSFDKRKLKMLGANNSCTCLYAQSEEKARYLFEFCRAVHQAIIRINQCFYACRDQFEPVKDSLLLSPEAVPTELLLLRQSPVSRVSSNSTSGVVSDKPSSETDKDFDWTACGSTAEMLSSSNVSPKSMSEHQNEHDILLRSGDEEARQTRSSRADSASKPHALEEKFSTEQFPADACIEKVFPKALTVDTSVGKMHALIEETNIGSVSSLFDAAVEKSYPRPLPVDTSVGRPGSDNPSFESSKEQLLAVHLANKGQYDVISGTPPSSSRTLLGDGEIVEDDISLGVPISLTGYPQADECLCVDAMESPLRSAVESSEVQSDTAQVIRRLRPSNSVNIASLYKLNDRPAKDLCASRFPRAENSRENPVCSVGIKQPPLYAEAVGMSRNVNAANIRSNPKVFTKQRWKTVAGVTAPLESNNTDLYQQFQYYQTQARSEPKLDLQFLSRSASPPPALHLSMQQLPVVQPQQNSFHAAGLPGKFQKQPRCPTRFPRPQTTSGINRVQSMPAHNPPRIQMYDVRNSDASTMLHHAQSLAVRPLSAENRQPPSYELAITQQARARAAQKNAAAEASMGSGDQSVQAPQTTFTTSESDSEAPVKEFRLMRLLLQEHQQENMDMLAAQNVGARAQPTVPSSHSAPQFVGDLVSSVNDDRFSETASNELRDLRTAFNSSSVLNETRSLRPFHSDLFDEAIFGDDTSFLQHADLYRGECYTEHPISFRHYAPYIVEQQAAQASWNPIPPPPPYPRQRSSASTLEAPMVM